MIDWASVQYFKPGEFACQCGCGVDGIQPGIVYAVDAIRQEFGKPLTITSGYRCPDHNERVSTTGRNGPHTSGLACDLGVSGRDAHRLLAIAMARGITGIGVKQSGTGRFLHLDLIPDSLTAKRPWIWDYGS